MPGVIIKGDRTLYNQRTKRYLEFVKEYENIKRKTHAEFVQVQQWCKARKIDKRNFLKYYNRYKQSGEASSLLPSRRGPKYKTRRADLHTEQQVKQLREAGNNRYEIAAILRSRLAGKAPKPSGVYNILRRTGMNRLEKKQKEIKRKIIRERMGQLGHIDTHHLSKYIVSGQLSKLYVVGIIDDYSRVCWAEIIEGIDSLNVMFGAMRCFMMLKGSYAIRFEEVITDNGSEFGNRSTVNKDKHPFERLLKEMGIKHLNTRPYRPQTNGKIERFWKTLNEDFLEDTDFDSIDHLKDELLQYLTYYNHERHHQGIGKKPVEMLHQVNPEK